MHIFTKQEKLSKNSFFGLQFVSFSICVFLFRGICINKAFQVGNTFRLSVQGNWADSGGRGAERFRWGGCGGGKDGAVILILS